MTFRAYVTDSLQIIAENTARISKGKYIQQRFLEILDGPKDTRTGDEIALDVINRAGLKFSAEGGDQVNESI